MTPAQNLYLASGLMVISYEPLELGVWNFVWR